MRFEGKDIEIRPLDNLNTRKENQDISDLSPDDKNFELYLDLKEKIPGFKDDFKNDIYSFLKNLSIKMNIEYDIEKINNIINNLQIRFLSSAGVSVFQNQENINEYNIAYYSNGSINFNLSDFVSPEENFKKIFYHEFLHALSTNNDKIFYEIEEDSNFKKIIGHQSTGLKFNGLKNKRFEWLNEAVTEQLAVQLTDSEKSFSYVKERKLLDILNKKKKEVINIDFDLLTKTYFRHIQKREEGDTSEVDDWKEFSKEIDKAFGKKFLVKLDLYIEKNGIDKAMEIISSWSNGEPKIDDLNTDSKDMIIPKGFYDVDDSEL